MARRMGCRLTLHGTLLAPWAYLVNL